MRYLIPTLIGVAVLLLRPSMSEADTFQHFFASVRNCLSSDQSEECIGQFLKPQITIPGSKKELTPSEFSRRVKEAPHPCNPLGGAKAWDLLKSCFEPTAKIEPIGPSAYYLMTKSGACPVSKEGDKWRLDSEPLCGC